MIPAAIPAARFVDLVDRLGRRQLGLVTRQQLAEAGMSPHAINHRVRACDLLIVRPGIYRTPGAPLSWQQCVLAAVLAAPPGSVASHSTAARLHRFRGLNSDLLEITAVRRTRRTGVIVHERPRLSSRDLSRVGPIPVTDPARTLCDLSGRLPINALARALDECLRSGQTTLARVNEAAGRAQSSACPLTSLRLLMAERSEGPARGESPLEEKILRWLHEGGLPSPVTQYRVRLDGRSYRFDACYPELRIAIECAGWYEHGKRSAFEPDLTRKNAIEIDGWLLLEFGDRHTRGEVVRAVAAARTSQAARLTGLKTTG